MKTLLALLSVSAALTLSWAFPKSRDTPSAPKCPPGTHLAPGGAPQHTVCLPCPPGQFSASPNRFPSCLYHQECRKPGEILLHEGSASRDAVCTCDEGERIYQSIKDRFGYTCALCTHGRLPKPVLNSLDRGDRGCCLAHQHAYRDARGQLLCKDRVIALTPTASPVVSTSLADVTVPSREKSDFVFWTHAFGFGLLGFIGGLVVAVVCVVVNKMRRCTTSNDKAQFLPVKS